MKLRRKDSNHVAGLLLTLVFLALSLVLLDRAQAAVFCVDTPDVSIRPQEADSIFLRGLSASVVKLDSGSVILSPEV